MRIFLTALSLAYSLSIHAVTLVPGLCEEDSFAKILQALQESGGSDGLKMSFDYSLDKDCNYTVSSDVIIPNSDSLDDFMKKLLDPATNLASADKSKVSDIKVTPEGSEFKQVAIAKKNGIRAEIISACKFTVKSSSLASYNCKTNVEASKTKGLASFRLFEKNETTVICQSGTPKKCKFTTSGKAKSILTKSSCDLAAPGAAETFESTYRLAHYMVHGNVNNIKKGKDVVDRFYTKAKGHSSIGKAAFSINDNL